MDSREGDSKLKINKNGWFNCDTTPTSSEVIFIIQVFVIFIVVITSLVNLSLKNGDSNLWTALLSCSLGYVLPNHRIKTSSAEIKI